MGEMFPFENLMDTSYTNSAIYVPSEKPVQRIKEESAPYVTSSGIAMTVETVLLDKLNFDFLELIARTREVSELDIPDIFTLQPLKTQRIMVKVRSIRPAQFYYVGGDFEDDDEE
jgi:hypothetical protein